VLRRTGRTLVELAKRSGASVRTVRRVVEATAVTTIANAAEPVRCQVGRPSTAEAFRDVIGQAVTEDPARKTGELLHCAKQAGYTGGKSAWYAWAQTVRARTGTPLGRVAGLAGESSPHDSDELEVRYPDEPEAVIRCFASRLTYARWAAVTPVPDERVEILVRTWVDHLAGLGGGPLVAVVDRLKTVAFQWRRAGVVREGHPTCAGVALDLGLGVEGCGPYRPQENGSVENLVGWVQESFVTRRRVLDREDLERQLAAGHLEPNTERPSRATGVTPATRLAEEQSRWRPWKVASADLARRLPVHVGPTAAVRHDTHPYSRPPDAIGLPGTLELYRDRVRIVAGRFRAEPTRQGSPGRARRCRSPARTGSRRCPRSVRSDPGHGSP